MSLLVRNAGLDDVAGAVRVHQDAFRGFLLTDLGSRFLGMMYAGFINIPGGTLLIAEGSAGQTLGLLAGTRVPAEFFAVMRQRQGISMAMAAVPGLFKHPLRVGERLLSAVLYRGDQPVDLPGYWLLSSLGVTTGQARKGVATALLVNFLEDAQRGHAHGVYLLTDQHNNDLALKFYARHGFEARSIKKRRSGRSLVVMARSFSP